MSWFKHKPNLVHKVSDWFIEYKCHCGEIYDKDYSICHVCGCLTKNSPLIPISGRMEWDADISSQPHYHGEIHRYAWEYSNCSNVVFVEKPEGCQIGK